MSAWPCPCKVTKSSPPPHLNLKYCPSRLLHTFSCLESYIFSQHRLMSHSGVTLANQTKERPVHELFPGASLNQSSMWIALVSQGKTPEFIKMGEIHEIFASVLSLVWFAGRLLIHFKLHLHYRKIAFEKKVVCVIVLGNKARETSASWSLDFFWSGEINIGQHGAQNTRWLCKKNFGGFNSGNGKRKRDIYIYI